MCYFSLICNAVYGICSRLIHLNLLCEKPFFSSHTWITRIDDSSYVKNMVYKNNLCVSFSSIGCTIGLAVMQPMLQGQLNVENTNLFYTL
jgi:hypothetical protein